MTTDTLRPGYVVDTSVVVKWFVQSDESDCQRARELREAFLQKHCNMSCPEFLALELANALQAGRRFTAREIKIVIESFRALDLVLEALRWSTLQKAVDLAASFSTAVYDSYFLASAIESNGILVTADDVFVRKVGRHPNLVTLRHLQLPR